MHVGNGQIRIDGANKVANPSRDTGVLTRELNLKIDVTGVRLLHPGAVKGGPDRVAESIDTPVGAHSHDLIRHVAGVMERSAKRILAMKKTPSKLLIHYYRSRAVWTVMLVDCAA